MSEHTFRNVASFIEAELADGTFPGAGLIVSLNGATVFERYWGTYCSRTRRDVPLDAGVTHMLYSFSKGVSATAIVIAHQRKLIDYDLPVSHYLPEYRGGWKDVTSIRHLLTHAAGIADCPMAAAYSPEEWEKCLYSCVDATVKFEPGTQTPYHWASGLFLAAETVRRVMGMASWESICRELLLDPIGATSMSFVIPDHDRVALSAQPKELPCEIDTKHFGGLGHPGAGVFGRLEDIIKVLQLHLNGGMWNGREIIALEELREMHRVQYESSIATAEREGKPVMHEPYGLGWLLKRNRTNHWFGLGTATSPATFGHAGVDTVMGVGDPQRKLVIAFLTTNTPKPTGENTTRIRNKVTDLVVEEIGCCGV